MPRALSCCPPIRFKIAAEQRWVLAELIPKAPPHSCANAYAVAIIRSASVVQRNASEITHPPSST